MSRVTLIPAVFLLSLALTACGGVELKPGDTARNSREIREGPGILTGSRGEFVIFRIDEKETVENGEQQQKSSESPTAK